MSEIDVYYDRFGKPSLRLLNDGRLVGYDGVNYFFVVDDAFYSYAGKQVGWIEGGIMRDLQGRVIAFGERPIDNPKPFLPYRQYKPYHGYVMYEPPRPYLPYKRYKPYKSFSWSPYSLIGNNDKK